MYNFDKDKIKFEERLNDFVQSEGISELKTSIRGVINTPDYIEEVKIMINNMVSKHSGLVCEIKHYARPFDMHATVYPRVTKVNNDGEILEGVKVLGSGKSSFYRPLPYGS